MKKTTLLLVLILATFTSVNAQNTEKQKADNYISKQGELTFSFQVNNPRDIELYAKEFSIINYNPETSTLIAWANEEQFRAFETKNIPYTVPTEENEVDENIIYDVRPLASRSTNRSTLSFPVNSYPTYVEYAAQMQDFEDDYPTLVEKFSIGTTGNGDKELLFVKISDNVSTDEQEPKLMLTSSMHGDEIAGYPMMLSLINYILTVYSNPAHADHARVKNLVENAEIWINPSANPDGTYNGSSTNTSVVNARRGNGNNIDLNRNYPDNVAGAHDDGNAYQTETLAFMAMAEANHFVIAANFHGGTELVNYPFDNAYVSQYTHADNDWFENISVEYATNAQTDANSGSTSGAPYSYKTSYMTDDDDSDVNPSPGVTHGAEWYRVYGGRQDYMNYYHQCREITIELSDTKILPESKLDDYWYYNRDALLDFLTQGTYGFRGAVKDANTNSPIDATITIVGHDVYGSNTVTDISHGDFYRPIEAGTYDILIEATCYQPVTLTNQTIANAQTVTLADVLLVPSNTVPTEITVSTVGATTATIDWNDDADSYNLQYKETGASTWTSVTGLTTNTYEITDLIVGVTYEVQVASICGTNSPSAYSSSITFTTQLSYCDARTSDDSDEYIQKVQIGSWSKTSEDGADGTGYSNFTQETPTDLEIDSQYTITITPEWTGNTYNEGYAVWIDYNRDGDFTTDERIFQNASTNDTFVSGQFTIPSGLTTGTTRMRVIMAYSATPNDPCDDSINYGEVEDYTVNIVLGDTLSTIVNTLEDLTIYPNPFNNSISIKLPNNLNNNSVTVNMYDIRGRLVVSLKNTQATNNIINISNLDKLSNGTYFLKIKNNQSNTEVVKKIVK
ncbi:T9SS type A sorting domain-containing protein [Lacinutrix sp. C3R15]|uniref:M14 family zinc carboxypeptidase n=1 Tax=Flavobacteriaceae TaxID=49546 RepID=UPI001C08DDCE|nr:MULTISPECIES: M14 family zinc carboxypeptidase [Flavobacteriaceae]MBU2938823.1 T9SS type A sorting domain-containing protein [Lacinutrix sp. C3R15]MDO6622136.1 M14 family zinc carboxypeptidase [Oceanihabitans sp. 1_MG-2023]